MCCLWGMLLSLHTAAKEFRNRYRAVGHGNSGCMQPAVVALRAVEHACQVANRVLWWPAAVYCKPTSRRQRKLTSRGWAETQSHGTGWQVRLRKTNSRMRQVGVRRRAMRCARLRT